MRIIGLVFISILISCSSVEHNAGEDDVIVENIDSENNDDKPFSDYYDSVRESDYSSQICLETVRELEGKYGYREILILLTECYDVNKGNIPLNLELVKYYAISYNDCGQTCIIHKEKGYEVLEHTLSIDKKFDNYHEFNLTQEFLLKLSEKWDGGDDKYKEKVFEWSIDKFSLTSEIFQNEIEGSWK